MERAVAGSHEKQNSKSCSCFGIPDGSGHLRGTAACNGPSRQLVLTNRRHLNQEGLPCVFAARRSFIFSFNCARCSAVNTFLDSVIADLRISRNLAFLSASESVVSALTASALAFASSRIFLICAFWSSVKFRSANIAPPCLCIPGVGCAAAGGLVCCS